MVQFFYQVGGTRGNMAYVKVLNADELEPGTGRVVSIGSKELALFNIDGEYHCIDNSCPHADGPLGAGDIEGDTVICPWHAWQFSVRTGEMEYNPNICVARFDCKVEDGAVLVDW